MAAGVDPSKSCSGVDDEPVGEDRLGDRLDVSRGHVGPTWVTATAAAARMVASAARGDAPMDRSGCALLASTRSRT